MDSNFRQKSNFGTFWSKTCFFFFKQNTKIFGIPSLHHLGRAKRICYLSPMRAAKVQASLRIRAVSPEPPLLARTSSESRGTFRQKARSIAPLNGWACAVEICHDGMLEDTNSLDGAHFIPAVVIIIETLFLVILMKDLLRAREVLY